MPNNVSRSLPDLFFRQKGLCYWCKCPMTMDLTSLRSGRQATVEHIVPRSRGGKSWVKQGKKRVKNLVAACADCNNKRGNMDAHEFRSTMRPHVQ